MTIALIIVAVFVLIILIILGTFDSLVKKPIIVQKGDGKFYVRTFKSGLYWDVEFTKQGAGMWNDFQHKITPTSYKTVEEAVDAVNFYLEKSEKQKYEQSIIKVIKLKEVITVYEKDELV